MKRSCKREDWLVPALRFVLNKQILNKSILFATRNTDNSGDFTKIYQITLAC